MTMTLATSDCRLLQPADFPVQKLDHNALDRKALDQFRSRPPVGSTLRHVRDPPTGDEMHLEMKSNPCFTTKAAF